MTQADKTKRFRKFKSFQEILKSGNQKNSQKLWKNPIDHVDHDQRNTVRREVTQIFVTQGRVEDELHILVVG